MSSERSGSTSPRIREFGLYRNIDARTEEFLKLSRKRQIRQGCTCAAVSTAITVTVVVSVILVHEYSFDSESILRTKNRSTYWYGLMNESDSHFNEKINKAKIYFDKTTVKLLPILIKALNNNTKLQKIIEEYAVPTPSFEMRNTTDLIIKKLTFTKNTNINLSKMRVHKKDYKSIQIVPFKKSSKKYDLFSKNRKSREYVNTSRYLDKTIEEIDINTKISTTSRYLNILITETHNSSTISNISNTRAHKNDKKWKYPVETTSFLPLIKPRINNVDVIEEINYKELKNITKNTNVLNNSELLNEMLNTKCECSKGIIILLRNFLVKLQTLIPNVKKILNLCHGKSRVTTKKNTLSILDKSLVNLSTTTTNEGLTTSGDSLKKVTSFTELIKNRNQELHDIELVNSIKKQMDNRRRVPHNPFAMLWLKPNYVKKYKPINETIFRNKYNSTTESNNKSVIVAFAKTEKLVPFSQSTRTHVVHDKSFQDTINSAETLTTTKSIMVTLNSGNAFNDTNTSSNNIYSKELKKILAKNKKTTYIPAPIYQTKKSTKEFRVEPKSYVPEYKILDNIDNFSRNSGISAHKKAGNSASSAARLNKVNVTGKSNIDQISIVEESNDFEEPKYDDVLPNDEIDDYGFKSVDYTQKQGQNRHNMTKIRARVNSTLNKQHRKNNRMNQLTSLLNSMIPRKQSNVRELMRNSNWSLDNRDDDYDLNINNNIYS